MPYGQQPQQVVVPLSLFGGLETELSAPDIPEGVSPDNQDVVYLPGSVAARPALSKVLTTAISGNPAIMYAKTYVDANGVPHNLILDSSGSLWVENPNSTPGVQTLLASVTPGCWARSVTAFGREYIALSDSNHGLDIPYQYDGTNFDRVSQDGPGASPSVQNYLPLPATLSGASSGSAVTISTVTPSDSKSFTVNTPSGPETITIYQQLTIVTSSAHGLAVGNSVALAGISNSNYDSLATTVQAVTNTTTFVVNYSSTSSASATGGTSTLLAPSLVRSNNVVTATTSAAHGFLVGSTVVISGITNIAIGGGISSCSSNGSAITFVTTSAHGLSVGANINVSGVTNANFDGNYTVATIISATSFTVTSSLATASSSSGNVNDVFNGSFIIASVPSTTTFTYANNGPNDESAVNGTATIQGQVAVGNRKCCVMFLTRQGYLTKPSPPVSFTSNGSQQLQITNIPIGPSNIVARYLAFTAADGADFFIIPATPSGGGTNTVINDNSTSQVIVDFSDSTLLAATGINVPGNNLFNQVVLGPCLGFFSFDDRLVAWGEYNKIQNLLDMSFDGGYLSGATTTPLGWTVGTDGYGSLVVGPLWGGGWKITGTGDSGVKHGLVSQSVYQDYNQIAIVQPSTKYTFRFWAESSANSLAGTIYAVLNSPSAGVIATASIAASGATTVGAWLQGAFNAATGATIPSDAVLEIYAEGLPASSYVTLDECKILYTEQLYEPLMRMSYAVNPEAFDGVTGVLGPTDDSSQILCMSQIRGVLYFRTANGKHSTQSNGNGEPATWTVTPVTNSVGAISFRSVDCGMAGDGDSGEQFDLCATYGGLYISDGGTDIKISQEIQSLWDGMNRTAQSTVWVKSDTATRRVYVGIPTGSATAPNLVLVLDRRELETATAIADSPPVHITITGKMRSSDLTRKWTKWNVQANSAERISRGNNTVELALCGGNGVAPPSAAAYGNLYTISSSKYTDDDYGQIYPYYTTYFFVSHDMERQLGLGSYRKFVTFLTAFITGIGSIQITPLPDSTSNPKTASSIRILSLTQAFDLQWNMQVAGERIAFKFASSPLGGETDNYFNMQKIAITMKAHPFSPVRGSTQ